MITVDTVVRSKLDELRAHLEDQLNSDVVALFGALIYGADHKTRLAVEALPKKRDRLCVVLDTPGGVVEVVERIVEALRHHYTEVHFVIPDRAMSAGTVLAMSGDAIWMDYFSRLGPIDPQVQKDERLVPALSYLVQYGRLIKKAEEGKLTAAEFALLDKLDLAELHQFELARVLSITLLKKWLVNYKFKNWIGKETSGVAVTPADRESRAEAIATILSDNERWHSHGRGISMETLRSELNLKIDDFGARNDLSGSVHDYHRFLWDYMRREGITHFVHSAGYF